MLRLVARFGDAVRQRPLPEEEPIVLGAGDSSDWVVPFPGISRVHARIEATDRGARITDLGSKNGIVIGDRRVGEHLLEPGHRVLLGRALLSLEEVATSDAVLALEIEATEGRSVEERAVRLRETAPVAVLRLIRDLERLGPGAGHAVRAALLERVVEAVGAEALWTFAPVEDDLFLRDCAGPLPGEEEAAAAREHALGRERLAEIEAGAGRLLLCAPEDDEGGILVARFGVGAAPPADWVRELLDHVARRLRAVPGQRRSAGLPPRDHLPGALLALVAGAARRAGKRVPGVSRRALRMLLDRRWPGGLEEVEEVVERAVALCPDGGALESGHVESAAAAAGAGPGGREGFTPLADRLAETERRAIGEALERAGGDVGRAAGLLGIDEVSLRSRLERLGRG